MGPGAPVFRLSKSENWPFHGLHPKRTKRKKERKKEKKVKRKKKKEKTRKCIHAPNRILTHDPSAAAADLRQLGYSLATHSLLFPIAASADKEDSYYACLLLSVLCKDAIKC
jgi:hypothetical protein